MVRAGDVRAFYEDNNRMKRMVTTCRYALDSSAYWRSVAGKDFLINIQNAGLRMSSLCKAVSWLSAVSAKPTIIINNSVGLENRLIAASEQGQLGRLYVISERFKEYNLFSSFTIEKSLELIRQQAVADNYSDISGIIDYASAFIRIMCLKYPLNYNGLLQLGQMKDNDIRRFGEFNGAAAFDIDVIRDNPRNGRFFREILLKYGQAFSQILSGENTNTCLAAINGEQAVYYLWARSQFQECFNREIAAELEQLLLNGISFNLIFSDFCFGENDPLLNFVLSYRSSLGVLGIVTPDAVTVEPFGNFETGICSSLSSLMIVKTGGESVSNFERVLGLLGRYMHYNPTVAVHRERSILPHPFRSTVDEAVVNYERLRVELSDVAYYPVVARGHEGNQVLIYTALK